MGNVHMEAAQVNYRGGSKKMSVEEAIKNAGSEITPEEKTWIDSIPTLTASNAGKTDQTVIAPEFDAEAGTYEIGDQVMYEGKLYKFTSAHETPGDWDSSEVSETTVADDLSSLESGLTNLGKHEVLTIAANTYTSWEDALTALYTAYTTLTADQKRTAYLILDDLYVANNSTISYGYFSRTLLISSSGGYGIRVDMYALANKVAVQGALYDGEAVNIVDITANAQTNKVALYY